MQENKNELISKFENLEKKRETISNKYDSKLMEIDKRIVKEQEIAVEEISKVDFEDLTISTEEAMELLVEMYEEIYSKTDLASVLKTLKNEYNEDLQDSETVSEKEYAEIMYKMNMETAEIENQMYNIAKAFLN